MVFGMPTLIEIPEIEDTLKLCRELSLSFVELNMNLPQYQTHSLEDNEEYLNELREKYQLYYTIHLDENLNIADFNNDVRQAYILTVTKTIDIAKKLGCPVLNAHMNHGVHFTLPDKKVQLFEQYRELYLSRITDFRDICEKTIGDSNIKICIENTDGYRGYEKEAIDILLQSTCFALTWDIGHSNAAGNVDENFIMPREKHLKHFHIHDSKGKSDHMTLGTGEIDLAQRLELAQKHDCRCVVETKTVEALRKSTEWLACRGYL